MKKAFFSRFILISLIALFYISCGDKKPYFIIEGTIGDADTTMLYLEKRSLTETTIIDSVKLDKDGEFRFKEENIGYPEFYLLRLNGQAINIAVDSTETITINASKPTFATNYTVEGSISTEKIKEVVLLQYKLSNTFSELKKKYDSNKESQTEYVTSLQEAIDEYKTNARKIIYGDPRSLSAYFALFQKVDSYLIFDPYDKKDLSVFQSVATVWDQFKSNSPRTEQLKNFTLMALAELRQIAQQEKTIEMLENSDPVEHATYYNITLPDLNNKQVSLSSLRDKIVILDFTAYQTDFSPAHNIQINSVYSKLKDKVEVYQVSFDNDKHVWQNSAVNLPWICVWDEKSLNSNLLAKFNIQGFPTIFLVNKKGDIVKRISSSDDLEKEVRKLL